MLGSALSLPFVASCTLLCGGGGGLDFPIRPCEIPLKEVLAACELLRGPLQGAAKLPV